MTAALPQQKACAIETERKPATAMAGRVKAARTSFYLAMRLLPKARRQAMFALYAFCREVDDIADDWPVPERAGALAAWRQEIEALYAGRPATVIGKALSQPVRVFSLKKEDFLAVIEGMTMDAAESIHAPTLAELDHYCDCVASAVGRLSVRIFGESGTAGVEVAHYLGRALQLTNILRDLGEDAARGRLYLPRELLLAAGIPLQAPAAVLRHPALPRVCQELAAQAEAHFAAAARAMAHCRRWPMRPARLMGALYHQLLRTLQRQAWRTPEERVSLPPWRKLLLLLRYGLL